MWASEPSCLSIWYKYLHIHGNMCKKYVYVVERRTTRGNCVLRTSLGTRISRNTCAPWCSSILLIIYDYESLRRKKEAARPIPEKTCHRHRQVCRLGILSLKTTSTTMFLLYMLSSMFNRMWFSMIPCSIGFEVSWSIRPSPWLSVCVGAQL